jgi:hypothetical protein
LIVMHASSRLSVSSRAREKQASRRRDARARGSARKSARRMKRENEVFAGLAPTARVNLRASRSLA